MDSFWTGGSDASEKVIRQHYEPLLNDLRKRRQTADESSHEELDSQITRTQADYKSKLDSIDDAIF